MEQFRFSMIIEGATEKAVGSIMQVLSTHRYKFYFDEYIFKKKSYNNQSISQI